MKSNIKVRNEDTSARAATQGLLGLLDYAIAEGTDLHRPLFVFLLKLARLALMEGEDITFRNISLVPLQHEN